MHIHTFTATIVLLLCAMLAASALPFSQAQAQTLGSYDYVRAYASDDNRSRIHVETHTSSGADIRNMVRTYTSSDGQNHAFNTSFSMSKFFSTSLSGSEEVPPVSTNTEGDAQFNIDVADEDMEYELNVYDGENITAAHLHCAPEGENGPVTVLLFSSNQGVDIDGTLSEGSIAESDITSNCSSIDDFDDLVEAMEDGDIYVNVHSAAHPNGVIRGQLEGEDVDHNDDESNDDSAVPDELFERIEALLERIGELTQLLHDMH